MFSSFEAYGFVRFGRTLVVAAALCAMPAAARAQVEFLGRTIDVHGFAAQGFAKTDTNNFLTMQTKDGSGELSDGGLNVSTKVTRSLRVGAQVYFRNIGDLGNGVPQLDWAFADYKFNDAVGIRGGKVKTPLGLYNDTQDMDFLHLWALLPQGVYPLDLRSFTIAHVGADVYGTVSLKKAGSLQYTVYGGEIQDDKHGGYRYGVEDRGMRLLGDVHNVGGGFDARWSTPVDGMMVGYSFLRTKLETQLALPPYPITFGLELPKWQQQAVYGDYEHGRFRASAEWRRYNQQIELTPQITPIPEKKGYAWFGSSSYRVADRVEVGSYHSRYVADTSLPSSADTNHINDTAITGRVDLNSFWSVKVEGHFIGGYGDPIDAHGFYPRNNSAGFDSKTKMLVVRTGINF